MVLRLLWLTPIHGEFDGDAQMGALDFFGVHHLQNAVDILVEGIALPDQPHILCLIVVDGLHVLGLEEGNLLLDLSGDDLIGVPARPAVKILMPL